MFCTKIGLIILTTGKLFANFDFRAGNEGEKLILFHVCEPELTLFTSVH